MVSKSNTVLKVAGSASFKAQPRVGGIESGVSYDLPGPGEYLNDNVIRAIGVTAGRKSSTGKDLQSFGVKTKRFDKSDTLPPGPGQYRLPDSCQIKNPKNDIASYKSTTEKGHGNSIGIIGINHPGVGAYNVNEFKAFGHQKLEGGGAPNNFTMCYKDINPCIRKVDTIPSPRLVNPEHRSKYSPNQLTLLIYISTSRNRTWIIHS